jgi:blocked-early-in-transport protein 1
MYNRPSERYAADRTAESLEGQNDEALEGLSAKVKLLKNVRLPLSAPSSRRLADASGVLAQITIGIGNEVRDSTKMLNGMVSRTSPLLPCSGSLGLSRRTTLSARPAVFSAGR